MTKYRTPTPEELYALEREARRLRAEEMARLARAGAAAVETFFARAISVLSAKVVRHA